MGVNHQSYPNHLRIPSVYSKYIPVTEIFQGHDITIPGWWYTYPSEKYESQWEGLSHILWKIKNVPNHQPYIIMGVIL